MVTGNEGFFYVNRQMQTLATTNFTLSFFHRTGTVASWNFYMTITGENRVQFQFQFSGNGIAMRILDAQGSGMGQEDQAVFVFPAQFLD
eukprot:3257814-Rhodomonas_salina.1